MPKWESTPRGRAQITPVCMQMPTKNSPNLKMQSIQSLLTAKNNVQSNITAPVYTDELETRALLA